MPKEKSAYTSNKTSSRQSSVGRSQSFLKKRQSWLSQHTFKEELTYFVVSSWIWCRTDVSTISGIKFWNWSICSCPATHSCTKYALFRIVAGLMVLHMIIKPAFNSRSHDVVLPRCLIWTEKHNAYRSFHTLWSKKITCSSIELQHKLACKLPW